MSPDEIQPTVRKTNRLAIASFVIGIVSIYPILLDMYFIMASGFHEIQISFINSLFDAYPQLGMYCFLGNFPFVCISLLTGIVALIQLSRQKGQKGEIYAVFSLVLGSLGLLFFLNILMDLIVNCTFLPIKLPGTCMAG